MGKSWDGSKIAYDLDLWREALRVLKPGGHLLAFSGTRTYHRMVCAIEDAGFEVRDQIGWMYGTGFPKSLDVSKAIDKAAGEQGEFGGPKSAAHAGWIDRGRMRGEDNEEGWQRPWMADAEKVSNAARQYLPATPEAQQWAGWGTSLKPAWEPICVARKPLIGTVAANVLEHGTGAINIDACRVPTPDGVPLFRNGNGDAVTAYGDGLHGSNRTGEIGAGRWPANVIHDGSDEVLEAFAQFGESKSRVGKPRGSAKPGDGWGMTKTDAEYNDEGSPARFFYSAKASAKDRAGSKHPTVKPVSLMRYLCKLVTPPGGTVLDPFAGSGTTGQAALEEGFRAVLIEREAEYHADIVRRLAAARKSMEKPAPAPKAKKARAPRPRKAPDPTWPNLLDLMAREAA